MATTAVVDKHRDFYGAVAEHNGKQIVDHSTTGEKPKDQFLLPTLSGNPVVDVFALVVWENPLL